ncbi:hypothetical protein QSU92_08685 [Microbacterium sp. ET2]|uniref:hypothetical protein n=1 Tax=Microbacterium albipurpureum TaxID=3050384 RepID=UPI00259CEBC0|nr:hypothetical protein [Microbacterium sp. ET2 (Ac-2212)]WJL94087.1 hypothetical protein QSU92_08685 [Microbacterium sp. ET2 (Ac-2212)]
MSAPSSHETFAQRLRERLGASGVLDAELRAAVTRAGAGDVVELEAPFGELARTIAEASYRVSDGQVAAVRDAVGSDKAAFEVVMSACVGAGLVRWDAATRAIEEAMDAAD